MIRDKLKCRRFEREFARKEELTIEQKYKILNALLQKARTLGVFPPKDPFEGVEIKMNFVKKSRQL